MNRIYHMIPIRSTNPLLPDFNLLIESIEGIYDTDIVTNMGPYHNAFERELSSYHNVPECTLVNNATSGLLLALKILDIKGEVIVTPFSFAATRQVIEFLNLTPVFCDLEPGSPNIDATKIINHVSETTSAVLATHCYGVPCNVETIEDVASAHNLQIIYDGAHAFGQKVKGQSIFNYGDVSVLSLHATKVFNSIEGGAIFASSELHKRFKLARNFGIGKEDTISDLGINTKMSELHAIFGSLNLRIVDAAIKCRKRIARLYLDNLSDKVTCLLQDGNETNYPYFPVLFKDHKQRDEAYCYLRKEKIYARRYFSPLLTDCPYELERLPYAVNFCHRVLCLPIHHKIAEHSAIKICKLIEKII